jgi:hypothetical protein
MQMFMCAILALIAMIFSTSVNAATIDLYVATNGNDSNSCLISAPCVTLQGAVNAAISNYNAAGNVVQINIAAGTYCGAEVAGPVAPQLSFFGTFNTIIQACAGQIAALDIHDYVDVWIQSLTLGGGTAANGADLWIRRHATVTLNDGWIFFRAAPFALVAISEHSELASGSYCITISGGAQYGFWLSSQAMAVLGTDCVHSIAGTPNFSQAFLSAIDGSYLNEGMGSTWTGSATGVRYSLALNSYIDTEQHTNPLPGSLPGVTYAGSHCYPNIGQGCN